MRRLALIAATFALLVQPVLAQDEADQLLGTGPQAQQAADSKAADAPAATSRTTTAPVAAKVIPDASTPGDPAQFSEIQRLNAAVLAADAAVVARNRAAAEAYRAEQARRAADQAAIDAKYRAERAAYDAEVARLAAEHAAWEERAKACRAGQYAACKPQ